MGNFDIYKAVGRSSKYNKEDSESLFSHRDSWAERKQDSNNKDGMGMELNNKLHVFDSIVSHSYLRKLNDCPVVSYNSGSQSEIGWYKIEKIVIDKDSFYPDKLSMLYNALHDVAGNVVLVISKNGTDDIEIFLGARDVSGDLYESVSLLGSAIQGYLPGVKAERLRKDPISYLDSSREFVASFSGIGSLRDDKKEEFVQGIEKFINATYNIPAFTAIFIAEKIGQSQATKVVNAYSNIKDALSPFASWQESINFNEAKGIARTLTKTFGETITDSLSETVTRSEGTSSGSSESRGTTNNYSINETPDILSGMMNTLFGGETYSTSNSESIQFSEQTGFHHDTSHGSQKGQSSSKCKQDSTAEGENYTITKGGSKQISRTNTIFQRYGDILDRHIDRIQNGMPFGLWSVATYFVSPDTTTSRKLANIYRGCIIGEKSYIDTNAVNFWNNIDSEKILKYITNAQHPRFLVDSINVSPGIIVNSKELAIHMSLPQSSVPGIVVRESVSFGRNIKKNTPDNESVSIGYINHLGLTSSKKVNLSIEELSKHVFVTGSTGSGKSNTVYLLVNNFLDKDKKVLIIEPTKGDYRKVFGDKMKVYGTRETEPNLLRINPFAFPERIQVVEHVERLVEIFGVCWPMYAAMPAILKDSILSAYESCGWNLRTSRCKYGILFPTIADVVFQLKRIIDSSCYSSDAKGDYIGALQTRLESLNNGVYSSILSSYKSIDYSDLYDSNVIIDLHRLGSSDTRSLLMGLIVLGLTEWRQSQGENKMNQQLNHVTILEEAHCILPRVSKQQRQESSNVLGKSVEMIASAIAEMRTYGESFIIVDQSPSAVDEAAIRNTNTKIVMNLPDGEDREIAGKAIALTKDNQISELARLSTGEAVVWQRGWDEAVMTSITEMTERTSCKFPSIFQKYNDNTDTYLSGSVLSYLFSNKVNFSESKLEGVKSEILTASAPSMVKAKLLDPIYDKTIIDPKEFLEASLLFLSLDKEILRLLGRFPNGSQEIIKSLKNYMIKSLGITDISMQATILSKLFQWVSSKSLKWHNACANSLK